MNRELLLLLLTSAALFCAVMALVHSSHARRHADETLRCAGLLRAQMPPRVMPPSPPPADDGIRFTGEMAKLKAEPGDVFVVKVDGILNMQQRERLRAHLRIITGAERVLVLDRGLQLEVRQLTVGEETERAAQLAAGMDCAHRCGVGHEVAAAIRKDAP